MMLMVTRALIQVICMSYVVTLISSELILYGCLIRYKNVSYNNVYTLLCFLAANRPDVFAIDEEVERIITFYMIEFDHLHFLTLDTQLSFF